MLPLFPMFLSFLIFNKCWRRSRAKRYRVIILQARLVYSTFLLFSWDCGIVLIMDFPTILSLPRTLSPFFYLKLTEG